MPELTSLERDAHIQVLRRVMRMLLPTGDPVQTAFGGGTAPHLFIRDVPHGDLGCLGVLLHRNHPGQLLLEVVGVHQYVGDRGKTLDISIWVKRGR